MSQTTSNLTNTELRSMFNVSERSPVYEHIKQTTNAYLFEHQRGRSWGSISGDIKRKIILIWKDFVDKYGPDRNDMNEIKRRAQTNNYNLTQRGLPSSYGASGALDREIVRWNIEERNELISILEHEARQRESIAGIKNKKRKHKSKKKHSKKKRSKKRRSRKKSKKR